MTRNATLPTPRHRPRRRVATLPGAVARLAFALTVVWATALTPPPARADGAADVRALIEQERFQEALDTVIVELSIRPNSVPLRLLHGVTLAKLGELEQAAQVFHELIADNPDDPQMFNNLAAIYASQGAYQNAEDMLQRALLLSPEYSVARANLGDLYMGMARSQYAEALRTSPDNTAIAARIDALDDIFGTREPRREIAVVRNAAPRDDDHPGKNVVGSAVHPIVETALVQVQNDLPLAPEPLDACFMVGPFLSDVQREQLQGWLERQGARVGQTDFEDERVLTQVYVPPQSSEAVARARVGELKSKGMHDIGLIKSGELQNGISLGVYRSAESVQRRLQQARRAGVEAHTQIETYRNTRPWLLVEPHAGSPVDARTVRILAGKVDVRASTCPP